MIIRADARAIPLRDECVQCVVTSPPYWGLRKYSGEQESVWGGSPNCAHEWSEKIKKGISGGLHGQAAGYEPNRFVPDDVQGICRICGAWRGGFGLEPTIELYIAHTVEILREIRRVLRPDGVVFWNIGDSYARSGGEQGGGNRELLHMEGIQKRMGKIPVGSGLKAKDLCLIPARTAIAAQADGWWIRSMIIWAKPNPMPESVTDRPTDAYEHIIMLTKSERYYWDADAVREKNKPESIERMMQPWNGNAVRDDPYGREQMVSGGRRGGKAPMCNVHPAGRNIRNVWTFPTQPYKGAHFATFPEELPRRCIIAASRVGDRVLDPFGGSGTTARVAIELNRRPISIDLAYHDHAEKRTRKVQRRLVGL